MTHIILALPPALATIAEAGFAHRPEGVRHEDPRRLSTVDLGNADVLVVPSDPGILNPALVDQCDRSGVRIAPYATSESGYRLAASFGLAPLTTLEPDHILNHEVPQHRDQIAGGVIVVWGPHGAPGRSTIAASLAAECARGGHPTALVDADTHAPALAMMLGLADDGPGFASACRSAQRRGLDPAELTRISQRLVLSDGVCAVLSGINRPSRWPELSVERVTASLEVARGWSETVVVDVAASLESDGAMVSDLDGPQRNDATVAAVRCADRIVAVASADAVGIARFIRAFDELRDLVGATPIHVVVNRVRSASLGIDAKGQIRRTLGRFCHIDDIIFLPDEPDIADGAALHNRAITDIAPRSAFAAGIRRLASVVLDRAENTSLPPTRRLWRRAKNNPGDAGVSPVAAQLG